MSQPSSFESQRWIVETDGKRYGPYTYSEIKTLLNNHQVKITDRVNTVDLAGKWISIQELFSNPIPGDNEADPAMSLFDALQIAKQRAAQRKLDAAPDFIEDFKTSSQPHPTTQLWFKVIGALLFFILVVEVVKLFPTKNSGDSPVASSRTITPVSSAPDTSGGGFHPAPPPPAMKSPAVVTQLQAAKVNSADKEKREREERERKARESREEKEREERERAEREQDEREREEAVRGREAREADFEGDEPPASEESAPGALKRGSRHPTSPDSDPIVPSPEGMPTE